LHSIAIALGLIGIGGGVAWIIIDAVNEMRLRVTRQPPRSALSAARIYLSYRYRWGGIEDVDKAFLLAPEKSSRSPAVLAEVRAKILMYRHALVIVERFDEGRPRLAGYAAMYPLSKDACVRILTGKVANGHQIPASDLCRTRKRAHGIYVAGMAGSSASIDRAATLIFFYDAIKRMLEGAPSAQYIFARPGSSQGAYWMNKVRFKPIDESTTEIWFLGLSGMDDLFRLGYHLLG